MLNNHEFKTIILDDNGQQLNISMNEARSLAQQQGLDVVKINQNKQSVVYKIMDYGKWKYDQKKNKKQKKQSHKPMKEVRFNIAIDSHDENTKINRIKKFLSQGHETYIKVIMRNRENQHAELAKQKLDNILSRLSESGKYDEKKIKCVTGHKRGYTGVCVVPGLPNKESKGQLNDEPAAKEKNDESNNKANNSLKIGPTAVS